MRLVVTGGRGFIGSHFVEEALRRGHHVIDIDKMTYAANKKLPWDSHENYTLVKKDICELEHLPSCDYLVNFAAESHVDNSIQSSKVFMKSNIEGVHNLLELIRGKIYERPVFFHISPDEVYGDIREGGFSEHHALKPSNPYSASKAAAEMLVLAHSRTYDLNYVITRSTNNYGERQYEEKLIPKCISCLKENREIPLHGDGSYVRDWIYVKDNVDAIFKIMDSHVTNEIFNIGANNEMTNLDVVKTVMSWFDKNDIQKSVKFVENRLGQDLRYSINCDKIFSMTSWRATVSGRLKKFI